MSKIPYKFASLRTLVSILQLVSAIGAAAALVTAVMRATAPIRDDFGRVIGNGDLGAAAIVLGIGLGQMVVVWIGCGVVTLLIERERNDRITHALLIRLMKRDEQG